MSARAVKRRRPYTPRMPAEQRRDQVLDAALQIIARDGYAAVSIDAIARELDVTRPVVYNVFDGLGPLLHALLDRQQRRAVSQLTATVASPPQDGDLAGYLRRTIVDLVAMVAENPMIWKPILLAALDTPPLVRERIERERESVRARFQTLVELAFATRPVSSGVDAVIVSHALLAIAEHFGRLVLRDPAGVDAERLGATVAALFLPAVRPRAGTR